MTDKTYLSDGTIRDLVNELKAVARNYHDHGSLRERIAGLLVPVLQDARARAMWPDTAEEVIAFVGSNFNAMREADNLEDVCYDLTVHDLLTAFFHWRYAFPDKHE